MKRLLLLVLLIGLNFPTLAQENVVITTYFLIRHAEKDRSNPENKNPHLIEKGRNRALRWSQVFKDIKLDAVYTTNYNRTIETANPTAASHHLKVIIYDPVNIDYLKFKTETEGKIILIVGHSNTTPGFVNALIGKEKYKQISDTNNANLYIVTVIGELIGDMQLFVK